MNHAFNPGVGFHPWFLPWNNDAGDLVTLQTTADNVTTDFSWTQPQPYAGYTSQEQDVKVHFMRRHFTSSCEATWTSGGVAVLDGLSKATDKDFYGERIQTSAVCLR